MTTRRWSKLRRAMTRAVFAAALATAGLVVATGMPVLDHQALAQTDGRVPGSALGNTNDSELWRQMRLGVAGTVSIPDKKAGIIIQSEGDNWRAIRNGPLSIYGGWMLLAVIVVLGIFFAIRGRIRIEAGASDQVIGTSSPLFWRCIGPWYRSGRKVRPIPAWPRAQSAPRFTG